MNISVIQVRITLAPESPYVFQDVGELTRVQDNDEGIEAEKDQGGCPEAKVLDDESGDSRPHKVSKVECGRPHAFKGQKVKHFFQILLISKSSVSFKIVLSC